jgi:hypothetical protein
LGKKIYNITFKNLVEKDIFSNIKNALHFLLNLHEEHQALGKASSPPEKLTRT